MKKNKIFKALFSLLLIVYLVIYVASSSGYYEYKNYKKMTLTEEQIEKFENDVKEGKEVNVEDYVIEETNVYDNRIAKVGKKLSFMISDTLSGVLSKSFKALSKFIVE